MTMPDTPAGGDALQGQILLELGRVSTQISQMSTQVAVMDERLKAVPDHENRIRFLEAAAQGVSGMRDAHARVVSWGAVAAAIGSAVAAYFHH